MVRKGGIGRISGMKKSSSWFRFHRCSEVPLSLLQFFSFFDVQALIEIRRN